MPARYFIRYRGRRVGPLTVDKLHQMARRGRFGRHYQVSTDGTHWQAATSFPELFPNDDDEIEQPENGGNEEYDATEIDPYAPLIDEGGSSTTGGRRRNSRSRGSIPPPTDDNGEFAAEPRQTRRRRRAPKTGDPEFPDELDVSGPVEDEDETPSRRRTFRDIRRESRASQSRGHDQTPVGDAPRHRRRPRPPEPISGDDNAPLVAPSSPNVASSSERQLTTDRDETSENLKEKKKSGGFLARLFGTGAEAADESPHLEQLRDTSAKLHPENFELEDLILIGAGQDELSVVGHNDTGDGLITLGLLTMIAFQSRSTDIHIEPKANDYDARIRVDGMLVHIAPLPKDVAHRVYGVIKVLCEIDLAGQLNVQEGSYSSDARGRRTDYRVSFTPSVHGQKLAIRVLDLKSVPTSIRQLGGSRTMIAKLRNVMAQNAGMVLMCGPTGSGKTTTLYSLIRGIDVHTRNVMTLEDPVEYQLEGITQIPIKSEHGKSFSDMLRALLRQDPDVLLLGEIRDGESARIALQAAVTGHLVLSTVHAQDTLATVFRLLDLDVDPNMVASSLDLVLSQRLVRVLCEHCKRRRRLEKAERKRLGRFARDSLAEPAGCEACLGTGYFGRRAIFEFLETTTALKEVLLKSPTLRQLRESVADTDFLTLREYGYHLVGAGVTSFSEVDRVVGVE